MRAWAGVLVVAIAALAASGVASAGGPVAALERALQQSNDLKSADLTVTEHVLVGRKTLVTLRITGLEEPRAKAGSFDYVASPAQTGLGNATIIVRGSAVYVHYPLFDVMQISNGNVKKWLVVNTHSSLGIDPAGLASLGVDEVRKMTGLRVVGPAVDAGVPVTRYRGRLALSKIRGSKQVQDLLASVPSAAAVILGGVETSDIDVGRDGFVHRLSATITTAPLQGQRLTIVVTAAFSNFNRSARPISAPPASLVMTLAQWQQITGSGASASNNALVAKVALHGGQVGAGYKLSQIPGGKLVQGETTLDFCNMSYASESLRTARLQVLYRARGNPTSLSNEVVTYQHGGAAQALQEVKHAAATCPNGHIANPPSGVTDLVRTTRVVSDPRLLPGSVAIIETDSAVVKGKHVTVKTMAVFQARGDVLSGVYGYGSSLAAVERLTEHAAEQSAADLRRYVPAGSGLPVA